ncbi:sugar transferase [Hoeflea sp.]|uniref:sugar transferase n=1 Tax=Hoeflea sp. TaxID=1940281 RepID=UPI0025BA3410|nr:sugar transferase [Hoeflea sp.]
MTAFQPIEAPGTVHVLDRKMRGRLPKRVIGYFLFSVLLLLDIIALLGAPAILSLIEPFRVRYDFLLGTAAIPVYVIIAANSGAYSIKALKKPIESVRSSVTSLVASQLAILAVIFFLKQAEEVSRLSLGLSAISMIGTLACARAVFGRYVHNAMQDGLVHALVLIDGVLPDLPEMDVPMVDADSLGLKPDLNDPQMLHLFGTLAKSFDRILVSSVPERQAEWSLLLKGANVEGEILLAESNSVGAIGFGTYQGRQTLLVSQKPLNMANRAKKRALDLALTVPLVIFLLPLMALLALAIKVDDGGPILFKQARIGRGNCQFKVLKFRSMRADSADLSGNRSAMRDDIRVTRIGRFIRATSLDELPQLFNVLAGDMSLVGPRPHALGSLAGERLFWEVDQMYWHRHQLKPGITGLAQVRGYRGPTLQMSDLTDRLQADMEYVQGWDIWRDISILLQTFRVVIHKNAF